MITAKPVRPLTTALILISCAQAAALATYQIGRLQAVQSHDLANIGLELGQFFLLAVAIVLPLWTVRCRDNAELIAPGSQPDSRSKAGWSWFIPVVDYWWPRQIVLNIWHASVPGEGSGLIELWWFSRLGSALAAVVGLGAHLDSVVLIAIALRVVSLIAFVPLSLRIASAQTTAIESRSICATH